MNKRLFLTTTIIGIVPGLLMLGKGIDDVTGHMIANVGMASTASLLVAYFIAAALILGIAIVHLINTYGEESHHNHSKKHKILASKTASAAIGLHPHKIFDTNVKNFIKPEKIIVAAVAIVAFISIIVMLT
ncbi:MAG TPA: hypothetical protein VEC16_05410 [Alphaproteobacteria bacterium]|nr:hypothetical protein [Alphaproteobacteria bacterium]